MRFSSVRQGNACSMQQAPPLLAGPLKQVVLRPRAAGSSHLPRIALGFPLLDL